jgi:cobalt transporter subunit CbtA
MALFRTIVFVAALAGLAAGAFLSVAQMFVTVPLILTAETYETAVEAAAAAIPAGHGHAAGTPAHDHDQSGWRPADGFERTAFTVAANVVTAIGLGLLLVAAAELAGGLGGWRRGMVWGLAGFAVVTLAPGLGLPPELPTMPAAALGDRQIWWIATALATAAGLALLVFGRHPLVAALGVLVIALPHLVGAPQPDGRESPIPADLERDFVAAVAVTSFAFWVVLGGIAGYLRGRIGADRPA